MVGLGVGTPLGHSRGGDRGCEEGCVEGFIELVGDVFREVSVGDFRAARGSCEVSRKTGSGTCSDTF